ncbi:MAG TPA: uroporphyrinogen-III synthase [Xanthobacteraceae bacterium]|nr:uroporphyrinogen-III synthase [Xanthobacteraceae bacterium]
MRVLVTRPEPDASRTAALLKARGHHVVLDPVLSLDLIPAVRAGGAFDAVAVTSATAVRAAQSNVDLDPLRRLPLYAVGRRTAEAAREAGFATVHDASGDAAALARLLSAMLPPGSRVLHLAGEDRARDLGPLLAAAKIEVEVLVLYRMLATERLGPAAAALKAGGLDAALHYSARSAAAFVRLAEQDGLADAVKKLRHFSLSDAVAAPLVALGVRAEVASEPNEAALLALLGR